LVVGGCLRRGKRGSCSHYAFGEMRHLRQPNPDFSERQLLQVHGANAVVLGVLNAAAAASLCSPQAALVHGSAISTCGGHVLNYNRLHAMTRPSASNAET